MLIGGAIVLLAFVAGIAGPWSPCGLSSVETLVAPEAGGGRRGPRIRALAMFGLGAIVGGMAIFGALSLIGWATIDTASWVLAGFLVIAAIADAMGLPVFPRIARQVPEAWRRRYPLSIVGFLYGGLLGLGLTTFVMSYGLWAALIGVLLIGDPAVGVAAGAAFGVGRALPVVVLAGWWERDWAERALEAMLVSPSTLRATRTAGAVVALIGAAAAPIGSASAASIPQAFSPVVDESGFVFSRPGGSVYVANGAPPDVIPGTGASIGGGRLAWIRDGVVTVVDLQTRGVVSELSVPGVNALAVHGDRLAMRRTVGRRSVLEVRNLALVDDVRRVLSGQAGSLSRPSLRGDTLVVARSSSRASTIFAVTLPDGSARPIRRPRPGVELRGASIGLDGSITWVEASSCKQRVMVSSIGGAGRRQIGSWKSTAVRDGGFEPGFVNAFNRASLCPSGKRGGGGRLRILEAVQGADVTYVSAIPAAGGAPRLLMRPQR
jgi:hypothetical protein